MNTNSHPREKIHFFKRISVRVTIIILIVLFLGIGTTISYYLGAQNTTIIESPEEAIMGESNVLYIAVKNNMLAGEAPIAVELFNEFSRTEDVADIRLYRADGVTAFSDNKTLDLVNRNPGREMLKGGCALAAMRLQMRCIHTLIRIRRVYLEIIFLSPW